MQGLIWSGGYSPRNQAGYSRLVIQPSETSFSDKMHAGACGVEYHLIEAANFTRDHHVGLEWC